MSRPAHAVAACVCLLALTAAPGLSGEPLPKRAIARLAVNKLAGGPILHVFFFPDGETVATREAAGKGRLWNAATGKEVGTLPEVHATSP